MLDKAGGGCTFIARSWKYDLDHVDAAYAVENSACAARQQFLFLGELENENIKIKRL